jgi:hypothetical protein
MFVRRSLSLFLAAALAALSGACSGQPAQPAVPDKPAESVRADKPAESAKADKPAETTRAPGEVRKNAQACSSASPITSNCPRAGTWSGRATMSS